MKSCLVGITLCGIASLLSAWPVFAVDVKASSEPAPSYGWLRDDSRQSAQVLAFLRDQNQQTERALQQQASVEQSLLDEWQARQASVADRPWQLAGSYNYRLSTADQSRLLLRQDARTGEVSTAVDLTPRSQQADYYQLGGWQVSPDHRYVAVTEDRRGDRNYRLSVIEQSSGQTVATLSEYAATDLVWSADSQSLYFVENEGGTYRPYQVVRWSLPQAHKEMLFREHNPAWLVSVYAATDDQYVIIQSNNHDSSEQMLVDSNSGKRLATLRPRESGIEYYADVRHASLFLASNRDGDLRLFRAALNEGDATNWQPFWQPAANQHIKNWLLFPEHIVLEVTEKSTSRVIVLDYQGQSLFDTIITPAGGVAWLSGNSNRYGRSVMIRSMSLTQPPRWLALDLTRMRIATLTEDRYRGIDAAAYQTEQIQVRHGGVSVPVTLAYRTDRINEKSPVFLYGYGAYGTPVRPYFMPQIISLLDRGVIYAIAHVRGGGYLGPQWYAQGKGHSKPHSFDDYLAVAQVIKAYRQGRDRPILALGGSAGGTLIAGALNRQPELFAGAVLQVPFVDVIATMSDPSLPLTRQEYAEWGDPRDPAQLAVMKTYSPNDNISPQAYPPMLVTAGLYDTQVPYWEPARWVMAIRDNSLSQGPYLLQTDLSGGHRQDARQAMRQQAREYAFLLHLAPTATQSP
ncbi:prolyl oligopeptidase family serine peptidase [Photobacterium sp. 2_MG-2023]|uniref:prolyl oligopeptidase family serine peptidase n=1 Tax=Photobacterium sp. 2_MG-2023 TaxID=3062663 RepID=UPI0026E4439F|nr:prolyl oligopeptidase family serine peptidase [Photobacterium sp. 2_MG-2023]MDO6582028.1 prolyl oligopeptidase family serine peptidase [Photobacterium sp. 2_MG-2023]